MDQQIILIIEIDLFNYLLFFDSLYCLFLFGVAVICFWAPYCYLIPSDLFLYKLEYFLKTMSFRDIEFIFFIRISIDIMYKNFMANFLWLAVVVG